MVKQRRHMSVFDWLNAAALLAVGLFLGLAIEKLLQLHGFAFWVTGIGTFLMFGAVILLDWLIEWLFERVFPSGINPSKKQKAIGRRPLALLLSLPFGIIIGILGAQLGLSDFLL